MKKFESIYQNDFEDYINRNLIERKNPLFRKMEEKAQELKVPILSPMSGEVLQYLVEREKPGKILELGTGLGYSTLWILSSGIPIHIDSLDRNKILLNFVNNWKPEMLGQGQSLDLWDMDCLAYCKEKISELQKYDFIFIDCDKIQYPEIFDVLITCNRSGMILVFDNVLWHGRLNPEEYTKPSDKAIQLFWEKVKKSNKKRTLLGGGDGMLLVRND